MSSKKTAVQILQEEMEYYLNPIPLPPNLLAIFEEAKLRERYQIEIAVQEGWDIDKNSHQYKFIGGQYYDETYGEGNINVQQ